MLDAMGEVLPAAVGVALSPFPIVAVVLVLGSSRATANGLAFTLGWMLGLGAATAILLVLTSEIDDGGGDASVVVAWLKIAIGVALLVLAVHKWRTRPQGDPEMPRWMASIDGISPPRAGGVGAVLSGANPKNLALTFAAASSIASLGLGGPDAAIAGVVYVVLASSTVLAAVVVHVIAGPRSEAPLSTIKEFMLANNTAIMVVILLVLGSMLVGDGLAGI